MLCHEDKSAAILASLRIDSKRTSQMRLQIAVIILTSAREIVSPKFSKAPPGGRRAAKTSPSRQWKDNRPMPAWIQYGSVGRLSTVP
ncbi:hypothetical protein V6N12_004794 [Hibiscus sabdariffa]|uniref:Uncharacterized protein n=1 Tax=Hibiscus sabdariffa TaxID=183260 RepID=A0ABR2CML4_9ROSI